MRSETALLSEKHYATFSLRQTYHTYIHIFALTSVMDDGVNQVVTA